MKLVRVEAIRGISDRDLERSIGACLRRDGGVLPRDRPWEEERCSWIDVDLCDLYERELVLFCHEPCDNRRSHESSVHENLSEPPTGSEALLGESRLELIVAQEAFTKEHRAKRRRPMLRRACEVEVRVVGGPNGRLARVTGPKLDHVRMELRLVFVLL